MKTLTAMIRKQKITVDVHKQALHALRQRHSESDIELQHRRGLCSEAEHYLWLQLTAGDISLDRLNLARSHNGEHRDRCNEVERQYNQLSVEVGDLEKTIAYAEKALEKFAELFAQRKRERHDAAQHSEWLALDEWVLNMRSQRA